MSDGAASALPLDAAGVLKRAARLMIDQVERFLISHA